MEYVMSTLQSVIETTSEREKLNTHVIVFLADFNEEYNEQVIANITNKYMLYVHSGFVIIIQASKDFYPPLTGLKQNFGDKEDRVHWRSKQVADFAFMFSFAANLSEYYLQLEDDVICADGFVSAIREFIQRQKRRWAVLEFSELGFIGKITECVNFEVLRTEFYWSIIEYIIVFQFL